MEQQFSQTFPDGIVSPSFQMLRWRQSTFWLVVNRSFLFVCFPSKHVFHHLNQEHVNDKDSQISIDTIFRSNSNYSMMRGFQFTFAGTVQRTLEHNCEGGARAPAQTQCTFQDPSLSPGRAISLEATEKGFLVIEIISYPQNFGICLKIINLNVFKTLAN